MSGWHSAIPLVLALTAGGLVGLLGMIVSRRWLWLRQAAYRGREAERDAAHLAESILALDAAERDARGRLSGELASLRAPLDVLVQATAELERASVQLPPRLRRRAHTARCTAQAVAQGVERLETLTSDAHW